MKRDEIALLILESLTKEKLALAEMYQKSIDSIGYFYIDDLLPEALVSEIHNAFPKPDEMMLKKSIREFKYVSAQMDKYDAILEEIIFAFQDQKIVDLISQICHCKALEPDAGGISMMGRDHFLNPHLDNSHDKDRNRWRVFNLLYYVTPNWKLENGGHLELWPNGLDKPPVLIENKFNRLVLMATHNKSLHSVNKVESDAERCCVSNYYFSNSPLMNSDTFHVTSFRARPGEVISDKLLQLDTFVRMSIRKIFKKGIKENPHYYKKESK